MRAKRNTPPADLTFNATKPAPKAAAIKGELEKCRALLNDTAKKRSRGQVSSLLVQVCEGTIRTLCLANVKFSKDLARDLSRVVDNLIGVLFELSEASSSVRNPARLKLSSLYNDLQSRLELNAEPPYNPLNVSELTRSIEYAFSRNAPVRLAQVKPFRGSGVYALYYTGDLSLYAPIAESNRGALGSWAIYVGKAGKESKRKGIELKETNAGRCAIYERLANQHTESITQATNLKIEDFWVRYLPIEGLFVPLCEKMLIAQHQPLWNNVVEGFGNKHMGLSRIHKKTGQQITAWDLLHPGRANRAVKSNKRFPTVALLEQAVRQSLEKAERERLPLAAAIEKAVEGTQEEADG